MSSNLNSNRYYSLDIVRSIAIILVLIWHIQPIKFIDINSDTSFLIKVINKMSLLFYSEISLIAVPSFFLVSLYIFFIKSNGYSSIYLKKRVVRIFDIFCIWSIVQFLIYYFLKFISLNNQILSLSFWLPDESLWQLIKMGGPSLPVVGDSVFYFLFNLILLIFICSIFLILKDKFGKTIDFLIYSLLPISIIIFEISRFSGNILPYHSLYNFLVYIPIAYFFSSLEPHEIKDKYAKRELISLVGLFFLLFIFKNQILGNTGIYSRVSLVIGSIFLFLLACKIDETKFFIKHKKQTSFLSTYSLGIFALHKYWQYIFLKISKSTEEINIMIVNHLTVHDLLNFILIVSFTSLSCYFAGKNDFLKKYVK